MIFKDFFLHRKKIVFAFSNHFKVLIEEKIYFQSDHKEFSDHAMGLLQDLLGYAKNVTDKGKKKSMI